MNLGLPEFYSSASALPFNRQSLDSCFELSTPDLNNNNEGFWLLLSGQKVFLTEHPENPQLPFGSLKLPPETLPLYIGNWQGRPCRMLYFNSDELLLKNLSSHSLNSRNPHIPLSILSLAGIGLMIQHWENSSRFCGYCGAQLTHIANEWGKQCSGCNRHHFPRIHPCVIGLVVKGRELLLVRKPEWADGRYGLVAGFVEFGESLEEAMVREIKEETAIDVQNLRYIGSQCWPFPSQIMNGFVADYKAGEISLQEDELAEGGWFTLDNLPNIPPRRSIARYLIDRAAEFID